MRFKVTRRDPLDRIPKPQVVGSIPIGGALQTPGKWASLRLLPTPYHRRLNPTQPVNQLPKSPRQAGTEA